MFYTVYKITNDLNGKIYIGTHKTNNPYDSYMGSGKWIKRSIAKYGVENFTKTIIKIFDNPEDMFDMELTLVNEDFVSRKDTYNLVTGGMNTIEYVNSVGRNLYPGHQEQALKNLKHGWDKIKELRKDPVWVKDQREKAKAGKLKKYGTLQPASFKGKNHTEETKKKISEKSKVHQKGSGNSQYGTCWIYSTIEKVSKKIKKEELNSYLKLGWEKGRKLKF